MTRCKCSGRKSLPAGLPAQLERHVRDAFVGNRRVEPVEAAQPLDIGNRLDVEGENRDHSIDVIAKAGI